MNIDKFNREHANLLVLVTELRELVQLGVAEHAEAIVKLLMSISSMVKLHLAAEDRVLYPALANSADPRVAQLGRQFQAEMGGLAAAYTTFAAHWNLAGKVAADPQRFRDEANTVFKALHQRIQRESRELYPLAEQHA
ncbi:hemerythrin domain-containing protein [Rhodanobacter sp. Col0626]|uniref:hemerythrin domain-containing protein n=1 Tax=Rhodanobacter sp. Col0626 TaxID=3415679 RepID=UPI003CE7190E